MWPWGLLVLSLWFLLRMIFDVFRIIFMIMPRPIQLVILAWLGLAGVWIIGGLIIRAVTDAH